MRLGLLSLLIFLPLLGALIVAVLPAEEERGGRKAKAASLFISLVELVLALTLWARFRPGQGFQMVEEARWVGLWGARYVVGVDGISLPLVVLTAILVPLGILGSWGIKNAKGFCLVMLVLEAGMLGVFLALDLLLFYVFWEGMLFPMYFLIGAWGYERRIYAAVKFFLYTLLGGVIMLVGIIALYFLHLKATGVGTFDLRELLSFTPARAAQLWLFAAFLAAFAIKVPIFPLHTWLPDAHTEAPTAGSVLLAGILLKMGVYGLLRFNLTLFPEAARTFRPILALLGLVGILYGGAVSAMQQDLKRLVAYSSVAHMGYSVLGVALATALSLEGAYFVLIAHGLATGTLFFLVGMLYERKHTRLIADYGGVAGALPVLSGFFLMAALASLGLPGLANFVGEVLVILGTYRVEPALAVGAAFGVLLAAVYMLWAYERVFHGPLRHPEDAGLADASLRERVVVVPLLILLLILGFFPRLVLDRAGPSLETVRERVGLARVEAGPAGGIGLGLEAGE